MYWYTILIGCISTNQRPRTMHLVSLIPRLLRNANVYTGRESLVSFPVWSWHNQNRTRAFRTEGKCFACKLFNQLCIWHSVCMIFARTPPPPPPHSHSSICVVSCLLPLLFFMFWAFGYAHTQLRFFHPLSNFDSAHMRKSTRPLHNFNVHVSEPGNKANTS